ncbi:hypothetical protein [Leucobacter luti]|uniref:Uncharacterized protein n=1 Tax=Leucobacter luti TaxID=340320 RepID=A0A4Q7U0V7_9MICO|nr:hypothetical protein [Leucobacter luti]RZT67041.1 hypothetical protein EV139_1173 [Leucobacter luti]
MTNRVVFKGKTTGSLVGKRVQLQVKQNRTWTKLSSSRVSADKTFRVATVATKPGAQQYRLYVSATQKTKAAKSETYSYTVAPLRGKEGVTEIFGTFTLKQNPKQALKLDPRTGISVWTADCRSVKGWKMAEGTSADNKFSLTVPRSGKYRITAVTEPATGAPWGARNPGCAKVEAVQAFAGERTLHDLQLTALGAIAITGKTPSGNSYQLYDRTGTKKMRSLYANGYENSAYPTTYKVVQENLQGKVISVFGTTSKDPAKGKTVRVTPGKAVRLDFAKGQSSPVKVFSGNIKVKISGKAEPGSTLTASVSKLPAGTKVTYQWVEDGEDIFKATGSRFKVKAENSTNHLMVAVVLSKPGYLDRILSAEVWVS